MRGAQLVVYAFIAFGLGCSNRLSQPSSPASSQNNQEFTIQVRIFADRGVPLPDGRRGGAVQVYGMRVEPDGSERMIWRTFLSEFHGGGLKFPHDYHYLGLGADRVYLHFPPHPGDELGVPARHVGFVELDRRTGVITRRAAPGDREFERLRSQHFWASMIIVDRPMVDAHGAQIGSSEFKLPEK